MPALLFRVPGQAVHAACCTAILLPSLMSALPKRPPRHATNRKTTPGIRGPKLGPVSQVKKEVEQLYTQFAPLWEREERERVRRWDLFLDTSFCSHLAGRPPEDAQVTQRLRRESHLQGLGVWLSEYHASCRLLSEERCTQVRTLRWMPGIDVRPL